MNFPNKIRGSFKLSETKIYSPASLPGVMGPQVNWHSNLWGLFWLDGRVTSVRNGGAGSLYHLKSGFAFRNASLYWKYSEYTTLNIPNNTYIKFSNNLCTVYTKKSLVYGLLGWLVVHVFNTNMQEKAECHFPTHQCQCLCHHYGGWQSNLNVNQPKTMHPSKDS